MTFGADEILDGFSNPLEAPGFPAGHAVFDDHGDGRAQFVRPLRTLDDASDDVALDPGGAFVVDLTVTGTVLAVSALASSTHVQTGQPVLFTAQPAPPSAGLSYSWDLGDGEPSAGSPSPTATHAYAFAGTYAARVTVADAGGDAGVSQPVVVQVSPADAAGGPGGEGSAGGESGHAGPAPGTGLVSSAATIAAGAPPTPPAPALPRSAVVVAGPSASQIAASLRRQIVPTGHGASIAALLRPGGIAVRVSALRPGRAVISWYRPATARTAGL